MAFKSYSIQKKCCHLPRKHFFQNKLKTKKKKKILLKKSKINISCKYQYTRIFQLISEKQEKGF